MTTTKETEMSTKPETQGELLPCPFCAAGETLIVENGKVWTGMQYSEPSSVSVRHWCPHPGQPGRMIERVGKDRQSAIEAWNTRAPLADGKAGGEPVMIYHGRHIIDCGEFGSHDMEMLKLIPAGTKLYTRPQPAAQVAQPDDGKDQA